MMMMMNISSGGEGTKSKVLRVESERNSFLLNQWRRTKIF
jgi:hypothetical protein